MNKQEYLRKPSTCPYCSSDNICSGSLDADGKIATAEVECNQCYRSWTDIWRLVDVREIDEEDDDAAPSP